MGAKLGFLLTSGRTQRPVQQRVVFIPVSCNEHAHGQPMFAIMGADVFRSLQGAVNHLRRYIHEQRNDTERHNGAQNCCATTDTRNDLRFLFG